MTKSHVVDYAGVLSDLRAKRKEIDVTISSLERLMNGSFVAPSNGHQDIPIIDPKLIVTRGKGIYESTVELLKNTGRTMKTAAIYQALINNGVVGNKTKIANVGVTLYKAVKGKKDCQIKLVGRGEWGLAS